MTKRKIRYASPKEVGDKGVTYFETPESREIKKAIARLRKLLT